MCVVRESAQQYSVINKPGTRPVSGLWIASTGQDKVQANGKGFFLLGFKDFTLGRPTKTVFSDPPLLGFMC